MKMMYGIPPAVVSAAQKYKKIHKVHQYIMTRICPVRCILSEEEPYQFIPPIPLYQTYHKNYQMVFVH